MKLKNITRGVKIIKNESSNWESLVGPNETIEVSNPSFNKKHFIILSKKEDKNNVKN